MLSDDLTRRDFLKLTSAGVLSLMLPWAIEACGGSEAAAKFFTEHERATLDAALARIFPTDQDAGAAETGAAKYIEQFLAAFDHNPPQIFGGGPFSGRTPYPNNASGEPSTDSPENSFPHFLDLSRTRDIAWRVRLFGSASVPGGDFNDAVLGPTKGFRDLYREGLQALDTKGQELSRKDFIDLTAGQQDEAIKLVDVEFATALVDHACEGMYCAPEYGGNAGLAGWTATKYDGDSQPLGYSIYDISTGGYKERPDKPNSTQNPDEDFKGFSVPTLEFLNAIVTGIGGKRFF